MLHSKLYLQLHSTLVFLLNIFRTNTIKQRINNKNNVLNQSITHPVPTQQRQPSPPDILKDSACPIMTVTVEISSRLFVLQCSRIFINTMMIAHDRPVRSVVHFTTFAVDFFLKSTKCLSDIRQTLRKSMRKSSKSKSRFSDV